MKAGINLVNSDVLVFSTGNTDCTQRVFPGGNRYLPGHQDHYCQNPETVVNKRPQLQQHVIVCYFLGVEVVGQGFISSALPRSGPSLYALQA